MLGKWVLSSVPGHRRPAAEHSSILVNYANHRLNTVRLEHIYALALLRGAVRPRYTRASIYARVVTLILRPLPSGLVLAGIIMFFS